MAKQLELRRGTTQANNLFTGAAGEVTMDTDTKQLRVHDGVKTGGYALDTLVAFQVPTSGNNYTWYRKYSSGWVEQGGKTEASSGDTAKNITFPIVMSDTHYSVLITLSGGLPYGSPGVNFGVKDNNTTTGMTVYTGNTAAAYWHVKGMAA